MAKVSSKFLVATGAALGGMLISTHAFIEARYRTLNKDENYVPLITSLYEDVIAIRDSKGKGYRSEANKIINRIENLTHFIEKNDDEKRINHEIKLITKSIRKLQNK